MQKCVGAAGKLRCDAASWRMHCRWRVLINSHNVLSLHHQQINQMKCASAEPGIAALHVQTQMCMMILELQNTKGVMLVDLPS